MRLKFIVLKEVPKEHLIEFSIFSRIRKGIYREDNYFRNLISIDPTDFYSIDYFLFITGRAARAYDLLSLMRIFKCL